MTAYYIEIKASAKKELAKLPKATAEKIRDQIRSLADNPRPVGYKKLVGAENSYRIPVSNYRVVYTIFDQKLLI